MRSFRRTAGSPVSLSNWDNVKSVDRGEVSKIRRDQRAIPLQGRRGNPSVRRLDRLAGASALVHDFGPECACTLVRIECEVQSQVLSESAAAGGAPIIGRGPEQQLGPSHKRNDQLMSGYGINASLAQGVVTIKQN